MIPSERHLQYLTPRAEITARLNAFQAELQRLGIAAAWIEHKSDLLYYCGSLQDGVLLLPASGAPVFYVRASFERAQHEAAVEVRRFPGNKRLFAEAAALLQAGGGLGLSLDVVPAAVYLRLVEALGNPRGIDLAQSIRRQRAVKSAWEIEQIAGATRQAEAALRFIPGVLRAGISELEFSAAVEGELRRLGHGGVLRLRRMGLELAMIMAVAGASASYPTNFDGPVGGESPYPASAPGAGTRLIAAGETAMSDMVTVYNGYHGDNARTFFLGDEPPAAARQAHEFCLQFMQRIERAALPGRTCVEVFRELDDWAKTRGEPPGFMGWGENRVKFFGHGVGLELDELPVIADRVEMRLQAGMVIAVEPKVFIPEIGPVGLENTCVLTENGLVSLCSADWEIVSV